MQDFNNFYIKRIVWHGVCRNVFEPLFEGETTMKKLFVLAISAILVANISAQEVKKEGCPNKGKEMTKEERIESDIKRFTYQLFLSDKQAEKFAVTYREYATKLDELREKCKELKDKSREMSDAELEKAIKERFAIKKNVIELQEKYYDKFRKDLNPRQVEQVLRCPGCNGSEGCKGSQGEMRQGPQGRQPEWGRQQGARPEWNKGQQWNQQGSGRGPKPEIERH